MDEIKNLKTEEVKRTTYSLPIEYGVTPDIPNLADKLMEIADEARSFSYSPYSKYSVGAALLCNDGSIYTGCNVETAAFTGVCAERSAIFKAISEGKKEYLAIAVSGGTHNSKPGFCTPCGVCRQVMAEFSGRQDLAVILRDENKEVKTMFLSDLLPYTFTL
jgi:cytidine deaminase